MLTTIYLYASNFEEPFLTDSRRFFTSEGLTALQMYDPAKFLQLVDRRLHEANDMANKYLDASTKRPLFSAIETCLLIPHTAQIVGKIVSCHFYRNRKIYVLFDDSYSERGFKQLIEEDKITDLKRMFVLNERVDKLLIVKTAWSDYIK